MTLFTEQEEGPNAIFSGKTRSLCTRHVNES